MGLYDEIDEIELQDRKPKLPEGTTKLKVSFMRDGKSNETGMRFYVVEGSVVTSTNEKIKAGDEYAVAIFENVRFPRYHLMPLKELAGAVTGEGMAVSDAATKLKTAAKDGTTYAGAVIEIVAVRNKNGKTDKEGVPYLNYSFRPVK